MLSLTQAWRANEHLVILEHDDNRWQVDLDKMEQKRIVQRFMRNKRRQVRFTLDDSSDCYTDPSTEDITKGVNET